MKQLSFILNAALLVAVGVLYYFHFNSNKSGATPQSNTATTTDTTSQQSQPVTEPLLIVPTATKNSKIVYVNIDILSDKYEYVKDKNRFFKTQQQKLESDYQSLMQRAQEEYQKYQSMAQAGIAPKTELMAKEEELKQMQEQGGQMEMKMKTLENDVQTSRQQMFKTLTDYLLQYNKQHHYDVIMPYIPSAGNLLLVNDSLDITNDILTGLNSQYKSKK